VLWLDDDVSNRQTSHPLHGRSLDVAATSVNDMVTVMTQVVDRHMREHPELEAMPEAVAVTGPRELVRA
jgi:hypothetical protein